jgi:hypothetical protein
MNQAPVTSSETKIRLTAFFVLILILAYLVTSNYWIILFLLGDFALRATAETAFYSPLATFSGLVSKALRLPAKPVYMPPKRFAARIGLTFIIAILIVHNSTLGTLVLSSIIALFAALESLAGFCAGCWVYNAFLRLRSR